MDKVEIIVKAGDGGDGVVSFRREKFVPFGGPDGGDGGKGGDVYIKGDESVTNLRDFWRVRWFGAGSGKHGGGQRKHGADGDDLVITVPLGTMVFARENKQELLLGDLSHPGDKFMVAKGGRGGLGNSHFATATNQAPRTATKGKSGEERMLVLDRKLIADAGIVGYPNVGKSTLLAAATAARPKAAAYPFTTIDPVVGQVEVGDKKFLLAEIPGLIEGAHLGKGLGHGFLRHAERTKVLIHLLDGTSPTLVEDMKKLNEELVLYKPSMGEKPQLVVVNKVDLPEVESRVADIRQNFDSLRLPVYFISAMSKQGVAELMSAVAMIVDKIDAENALKEGPIVVFRPKPKTKPARK